MRSKQFPILIAVVIFGAGFLMCCGILGVMVTNVRKGLAENAAEAEAEAAARQTPEEKRIEPFKFRLRVNSETIVRNSLKAPSTAKFDQDRGIAVVGPKGFAVTGYVTSQNEFGVPLKHVYLVRWITPDAANSALQPVSIKVGEQEQIVDEALLAMFKDQMHQPLK